MPREVRGRMTSVPAEQDTRGARVAERWSVPVLIAALASIPATFLTLFDGAYQTAGNTLHVLSGSVLVAETVVLLAIAEDKREWLRRNRWLVALTVAIVPAVLLAVGPLQLLRLVRVAGALRILRVRRILKAGRIIRSRYGFTSGWERAVTVGLTLVTAAFVALVLADPTSRSRELLEDVTGRVGVLGIVLAGVVLAAATYVVRTNRGR
jgi:CsoR family transcriptional regulator, copper-sensing transcriptional repressor